MSLFDIFKAKEYRQRAEGLQAKLDELGYTEYSQVKSKIEEMTAESERHLALVTAELESKVASVNAELELKRATALKLAQDIIERTEASDKLEKQCAAASRKIAKIKELYRAVENAVKEAHTTDHTPILLSNEDRAEFDLLAPVVTLKLHCQDMRDLRKAYRENEKSIDTVVAAYKARYTTKTNQTIYDLMVVALRAEIQNILYALKYEKLDVAVDQVKQVTAKYLEVAASGNQSIAPTLKKFIAEIEYLFINAVKIEYNYYVKKEQAKQEQAAIREQMRQEAEERKALERERKRIEAEEKKYQDQIDALRTKLETATEEEKAVIETEITKVEANMSDVVLKKDEIVKLEHGKAGYIYIISNLGSFGDDVFKIGMTRRSDPQDRVDELGDASVPFKYDVHSFIFSEDAVSLEAELHNRLNDKRVNKVNLRKEFFRTTVDELEELTNEISPAAEFNKTMLAEEFRQSLSADGNYTSDFVPDEDEDEDLENNAKH